MNQPAPPPPPVVTTVVRSAGFCSIIFPFPEWPDTLQTPGCEKIPPKVGHRDAVVSLIGGL